MVKKGLTNILDQLDKKDWFQKLLDEIFEKDKRPRRVIDYFYASWSGDCPRAIQYGMNGLMPDDFDAQGRRRMDNGNYMHSRFGDYFKKIDKLIDEEPVFKKDLDGVFVSGRGDLIVKNETDIKTLIELKSINDRRFKLILPAPEEGDYLQWNLCAKALGFSSGIILYENKNTQEIKYHHVTYDENRYRIVIDDFLMIDKCNKLGTLVPKPTKCPNSFWCPMKRTCK